MNKPKKAFSRAMAQMRGWSWLKRTYATIFAVGFIISSFLFLTPTGEASREWMAQTVITTQHRSWAWMFVGGEKRDRMVAQLHLDRELMGTERQNFDMINVGGSTKTVKRTAEELIKVEDISAPLWKGKKMYVYDPRAIRVVVPSKSGEGERISSMVERTGAYAGINGGGFVDPDGLGNGFAPIGFIISGGEILYTDQDGSIAQHVVGFTKEGVLVVGKYTIDQLLEMGISEAVMFYPRVIANGKGLITSGDGGWGRGPRTAIGQKEDGTVVIMVIDGRQTHSVGATLKEIQDLMLEEGVVNAGFLDGGASSELVTQADGLITKPSSRYGERRLPSALLVFGDPSDYVPNNPWEGVTEIDPGGAYDHPDFLKEQAENRNKPKPSVSPSASSSATPKPDKSAEPDSSASGKPASPEASGSPGAGQPSGAAPGGSASPGASPGAGGTASPGTGTGAGNSPSPGATAGAGGSATPGTGTATPKPSSSAGTETGASVQPSVKATSTASPGGVKLPGASAGQQSDAAGVAKPSTTPATTGGAGNGAAVSPGSAAANAGSGG
ncbi:phosphodiester glycosidase family protein [Paenibacillus sp. YN15]|uniref:phosphodiester glycosidase family protein n=1 Tax=Paenibacillus sp. YN15 TaxID=1742774 RepID=UPI00215C4746|nr:phosphodiester glycosidase family protein [Paenibacillus sp. YN15]